MAGTVQIDPASQQRADPVGPAALDGRPSLLVCCGAWGRPSEVWMGRQVRSVRRFRVSVACWENASDENDLPVRTIPFPRSPEHGRGRWPIRLRNVTGGNFYGTVGAESRVIRDLLCEERPDVILCHYGMSALRILPETRRLGIPIVAHFNGVDLSGGLRNRWYRWSLERWAKQLDAAVVVAGYMRRWLARHGLDQGRVHQIPYGVPIGDFQPAKNVSHQPCRFVAVGRLVEKKAPLHVVRAFAKAAGVVPGVALTMIGAGPLLEPAQKLAAELGVAQSVTFTGAQPASRVREEIGAAGAYLQHSVTATSGDMEGWPVAVAEAMACGVPVVATRHSEIPHQVVDGETGFLVDEHDWGGMGDAMVRLAKDPVLRERLGAAGRDRAVSHFDLANQVRQLEDVLDSVRKR